MENIRLNTIFLALLVVTLILFTINYVIDPVETGKNIVESKELTGEMQTFEVTHSGFDSYHPTKKTTKRYDNKLLVYLEHIQWQRDKTFDKGKVFLRQK